MTVAKLIKALEKFPKDAVVEVYQYNHGALEEATMVTLARYTEKSEDLPDTAVVIS